MWQALTCQCIICLTAKAIQVCIQSKHFERFSISERKIIQQQICTWKQDHVLKQKENSRSTICGPFLSIDIHVHACIWSWLKNTMNFYIVLYTTKRWQITSALRSGFSRNLGKVKQNKTFPAIVLLCGRPFQSL
jgi:hypothetical protein